MTLPDSQRPDDSPEARDSDNIDPTRGSQDFVEDSSSDSDSEPDGTGSAIVSLAQRLDAAYEAAGQGTSFPIESSDRRRIRAAWQVLAKVAQQSPRGPDAAEDQRESDQSKGPSRFFYPH